ncbi:MAG: hypothetical protein JRH16_17720 [Deltaproteobacteria bacterium]|nr:hypothetical protein [Deltaproteobacteria bacterium]MBW2361031.1 hypothetical protein [Deltaproteobacteria bacterium]
MGRSSLLLTLLPLLAAGCVVPARGTPVHVDMRAGKFWSGSGQLLEVSADEGRCLVAIRGSSLLVTEKWVSCDSVHPRHSRDHF